MRERVLRAHFTDGENPGAREVLLACAAQAGLDVLRIIIDLLTKRLESSGRSYCNLDIITGKGLHSKHRAVLYPEVQRLLREEGYKVSGGDGKIRLTVQI